MKKLQILICLALTAFAAFGATTHHSSVLSKGDSDGVVQGL